MTRSGAMTRFDRCIGSRTRGGELGFTLIEVMIALAILAGGLVFLMRSTASNIFAAQQAQMLTAATNLARGKMYEIEEQLLADGFQELDQTEEGNFADDGWPSIAWKAEIVKIELPDMSSLQAMGSQGKQEGESATPGGTPPGETPPGGLLGGMLGMGGMAGLGGTAGDSSNPLGTAIMGTYYSVVSDVLKDAIRKVTLTVSYPVASGETASFVVTCYFTDPATVNRKVPFAGGGEEPEQPARPGGNASPGGNSSSGGNPPGAQPARGRGSIVGPGGRR